MAGITNINAISDYLTRFMKSDDNGSTWEMVCPIKGSPQFGGQPEMLDVSTNEDAVERQIIGRQKLENTSVQTYYDATMYSALKAMENKTMKMAMWLGPEGKGECGCFEFDGQISVQKNATEGNTPHSVTIYIAIAGKVTFKEKAPAASGT